MVNNKDAASNTIKKDILEKFNKVRQEVKPKKLNVGYSKEYNSKNPEVFVKLKK